MSDPTATRIPSLVKKYLMAASGLVLVLFVLGHMLGNLQIFAATPGPINHYANFLQSLGEILWAVRLFLLACIAVHIWMAILLTLENRRARGPGYQQNATVQATYASRTMLWSGLIVLAFIIFHLAHYTLQVIHPIFKLLEYTENGLRMHDVFAMVLVGFSYPAVAAFYVFAIGLLCLHLSHGVSSMFQSLGVRNAKWRAFLDKTALAYGWLIFLGFIAVPVAVQISLHSDHELLPVREVLAQIEKADASWDASRPVPVEVDYNFPPAASAAPAKTADAANAKN
ncbi:MAG TPA: succinate dehydrogenase cytochrome b subunit [Opitutales bacterium]|jgi:succinate dehydrogenase / fumarate reductase cytochrome b subunit|nr:succinate dehydrogenase cytochrome b subunit [Opitutales bacterium]